MSVEVTCSARPITHRETSHGVSTIHSLDLLDRGKIYYSLERTRSDSVQVNTIFVGARVEIEVFADGHFEISRFLGNEDDESGSIEMIRALIAELS